MTTLPPPISLSQVPTLFKSGDFAAAAAICEEAIASNIQPDQAHNYLAYIRLREGNTAAAAEHGRKACELSPASAPFLVNYARSLAAAKRHDDALTALDRAAHLSPTWSEPFTLGAEILIDRGRFSAAAARCRAGLAVSPNDFDLQFVLADALCSLMQPREAIDLLTPFRAKRPTDFRLASNIAHYWNFVAPPGPLPGEPLTLAHCTPDQAPVLAAHKAAGQSLTRYLPPPYKRSGSLARTPGSRLRVGIISPDLRDHSVAFFIESFFTHRSRERIELFAYYTHERPDSITHRLESLADHWRSMQSMTRDALAKQLAADGLDILIELAGHTRGQVLDIARCGLATATISYLGYPNTTGTAGITHRIVDSITDPPGPADALATEKLLRLDPCFICFTPSPAAPAIAPLPALTSGCITLGSFNNLRKLNAPTIALWSDVLLSIPNSRLLLKAQGLGESETADLVAMKFAERGIVRSRLDLRGHIDDPEGHLAAYKHIDIALDPTPYNGTTTTCEALWMGTPTLTLTGNCHSARVGTSLLSAVGLPQCIAASPSEFVQRASEIAADLPALASLRSQLRDTTRASLLCDGEAYSRRLEQLLLTVA